METLTLDLFYLESDPRTGQPSAGIAVKASGDGNDAGAKHEQLSVAASSADRLLVGPLLIGPCTGFIELDAEIRRLHAELDEIRCRAKKKFYRAHAAANGA